MHSISWGSESRDTALSLRPFTLIVPNLVHGSSTFPPEIAITQCSSATIKHRSWLWILMLNAESETQRPAPSDASGSVSSWAMLAAYVNAYWEAVSFMSCFGLLCWSLGDESAHRLSGWSHRSNSRAEKSPAWLFIYKCLLFGRICVGFSMV